MAEVELRTGEPVVVVGVSGEIDLFNADTVGGQLRDAATPGAHALVLDLSALEFLDSTGIRQLFALSTYLAERRQRMRVVVADGSPVARTLALVDFGQAAPLATDLAAVLAELAPSDAGPVLDP